MPTGFFVRTIFICFSLQKKPLSRHPVKDDTRRDTRTWRGRGSGREETFYSSCVHRRVQETSQTELKIKVSALAFVGDVL